MFRSWLIAVLVAVLAGSLAWFLTAEPTDGHDNFSLSAHVVMDARILADGRVEFGLRYHEGDRYSERIFPERRYLPPTAKIGTWYRSGQIDIGWNVSQFDGAMHPGCINAVAVMLTGLERALETGWRAEWIPKDEWVAGARADIEFLCEIELPSW